MVKLTWHSNCFSDHNGTVPTLMGFVETKMSFNNMDYLFTLVKIDQWSQREKRHIIVTLPLCFHLPNSFDLFLIFGGHQSFL